MVRFTRTEHRNLSDTEAMWHVIFNQHLAKTVRWGEGVNIAVVVVRPNFCNDRNLARGVQGFAFPVATFDDGEPQPEMNDGIPGQAGATVGSGNGVNRNVDGTDGINTEGAVHAHTGIDVLVVVQQLVSLPRLGINIGGIERLGNRFVLPKTPSQHAGGKEHHHHQWLEVHEFTEWVADLNQSHACCSFLF